MNIDKIDEKTVCTPGYNSHILEGVVHWEATLVRDTGDTHFSLAMI